MTFDTRVYNYLQYYMSLEDYMTFVLYTCINF